METVRFSQVSVENESRAGWNRDLVHELKLKFVFNTFVLYRN